MIFLRRKLKLFFQLLIELLTNLQSLVKTHNRVVYPRVSLIFFFTVLRFLYFNRPWNEVNSRLRDNGKYYTEGWTSAFSVPEVSVISITSFNEWHEGTQIEPASDQPKQGDYAYLTYNPLQPDYYLDTTKNWSIKLEKRNSKVNSLGKFQA